jgi:Domain of unknown function (DUF6484)
MSSSRAATSKRISSAATEGQTLHDPARRAVALTSRIGRLVSRLPDGNCVVDYPGNVHGPLPALALASCAEALAGGPVGKRRVLLVFDGGDPRAPVIVGVLEKATKSPLQVLSVGGRPAQVQMDGDTLVLRAQHNVRIECGESSLSLNADGTVLIKGRKVMSRASESNRIRGSTVAVN